MYYYSRFLGYLLLLEVLLQLFLGVTEYWIHSPHVLK